jgi:hypothetical protein
MFLITTASEAWTIETGGTEEGDERRRRRHLYYAEISDGPKVDLFFFFLLTLPGIVEAGCEVQGILT